MVTERNCKPATAKFNLKMVKEFSRFLKLEYGQDTFDPLSIEPRHVRCYLIHLKKNRENSTGTSNNKLSALKSYYFSGCFEYIEEDQNPMLHLLERYKDQRISFTNALSFSVMNKLKISDAFAYNRQFLIAGFNVINKI